MQFHTHSCVVFSWLGAGEVESGSADVPAWCPLPVPLPSLPFCCAIISPARSRGGYGCVCRLAPFLHGKSQVGVCQKNRARPQDQAIGMRFPKAVGARDGL